MRPRITVVDPWHWLTETGSLPPEPRLRARMLRVVQCIEAAGPLPPGHTRETLIPCRRRPSGQTCRGLLWVVKEGSGTIYAFCPTCGTEEFLIHNWEDTDWAEGPMDPMPVEEIFVAPDQTTARPRDPASHRAGPHHVHHAAPPARPPPAVGTNAPCPCGSGRPYARCCGVH